MAAGARELLPRPRVAAVGVFLAFLASTCAALSSSVYSPSSKVSEYHHYQISFSLAYAQNLVVRPGVMLAVGIIVFLLLVFWSMCRCCSCCGCKRPAMKTDGPDNWRIFYTLTAVALTVGCVVMVLYGFKSNSTQSTAFSDVVSLVEIIIAWKSDTVTAIVGVSNSSQDLINDISALAAQDSGNNYMSAGDRNDIQTACQSIKTQCDTIVSGINSLDVASLRSTLADKVSDYDSKRSMVIIASLSVLLVCSLLAIFFSLADSYFSKSCQPRRYLVCRIISLVLAILTVLVVLLAWIVAALLYTGSAGMADFCIAPTDNTISLLSISNDLALYYLKCNYMNLAFPYANEILSIQTSFSTVNSKLTAAQVNIGGQPGCSGNAQCTAVNTTLTTMRVHLTQLNSHIGIDTNGDNQYDTGMLKQISCATVNGIYQSFLNAFCGDGFLAVSSCFETFIAFACFVVLAEFVRRKLPVTSMTAVAPAPANAPSPSPSPQRALFPNVNAAPLKAKTPPLLPGPAAPVLVLTPLMQPGETVGSGGAGMEFAGGVYPFHAGPPFLQASSAFPAEGYDHGQTQV